MGVYHFFSHIICLFHFYFARLEINICILEELCFVQVLGKNPEKIRKKELTCISIVRVAANPKVVGLALLSHSYILDTRCPLDITVWEHRERDQSIWRN